MVRDFRSNNPEQEVWNVVFGFESEHYVRGFANSRLSSKCYGFNFSELEARKKAHNDIKSKNEQAEILKPLQLDDLTDELIAEVANNARQARDFYHASKDLPMLSRPILLFYAFEKLANVLILLTYKIEKESKYSHGISFHKSKPIEVKPVGLFPRFHDCYSTDPSIYLDKFSLGFEDILAGQLYETYLYNAVVVRNPANYQIRNLNNNEKVGITELDREFLFMFALSSLARYRVNEWNEIVRGKENQLIIRIQRYLQSIQMIFPNLVLNLLYGDVCYFY